MRLVFLLLAWPVVVLWNLWDRIKEWWDEADDEDKIAHSVLLVGTVVTVLILLG